MKYAKMLGLLAVAAAALMAFAGTASATILTTSAGQPKEGYTGEIKAEAGKTTLSGSFVTVECAESTTAGSVESHGASVTAAGKLSSLTFSTCNYGVTVNNPGSLEIHTDSASADGNGTLTSTGAEVTIKTSVGTCIFTTNATDVGTVKGGTPAVMEIKGAKIPRTGGSAGFLCGSTGTWNGTYTVTTPGTLLVD